MKKREYKSYYERNTLKKFFYIIFSPIAYILALIPKRKDLVLYGSMNGYSIVDNAKYEYLSSNDKEKYFITFNPDVVNSYQKTKFNVVYGWSLKGIFLQIRAEKIYFTHGLFDFFSILVMGAEKHNLWHGVPLKDIGPVTDWSSDNKFMLKIKILFYRIFAPAYYMTCDYVYCPFPSLKKNYSNYFCVSRPKIIIREQPRNSYFNDVVIQKKRKILFAPTHRSLQFKNFDFDLYFKKINLVKISNYLKSINYDLVVRPHPIDKELFVSFCDVNNIEIDTSLDLYESLSSYEFVVTDYSSIFLDCMERQLSCFLVAPDYREYKDRVGISNILDSYYSNDNFYKDLDFIKSKLVGP
ncbi:CDP-glycerol glycerophosphotransferase family protein [Paenalcaligenes suwonensis]|uniref:CDP-glycerol glycerophosphotransferase family protein n=1 Tax=Paenalcaligenes suwonensis TaxID=1202713 RepID=UPI001408BFAE|nr:CDP-glycerol glycerophosphotransferase family protein [Paenalcaligenes suwonensis]NHC60265.1 hypothetical protein [Paenalcaligenes suwonensis]